MAKFEVSESDYLRHQLDKANARADAAEAKAASMERKLEFTAKHVQRKAERQIDGTWCEFTELFVPEHESPSLRQSLLDMAEMIGSVPEPSKGYVRQSISCTFRRHSRPGLGAGQIRCCIFDQQIVEPEHAARL